MRLPTMSTYTTRTHYHKHNLTQLTENIYGGGRAYARGPSSVSRNQIKIKNMNATNESHHITAIHTIPLQRIEQFSNVYFSRFNVECRSLARSLAHSLTREFVSYLQNHCYSLVHHCYSAQRLVYLGFFFFFNFWICKFFLCSLRCICPVPCVNMCVHLFVKCLRCTLYRPLFALASPTHRHHDHRHRYTCTHTRSRSRSLNSRICMKCTLFGTMAHLDQRITGSTQRRCDGANRVNNIEILF